MDRLAFSPPNRTSDAVLLYDHLNGTAGGQETKLTKVEAEVLAIIAKAGWPEFTVQQIQQATGRSSSHVRKIMNGYISRGYTYSGLLEKCPAISYTDRTVMTNDEPGLSIKRRTIAYQFNPDIFRHWSKGGSCWLDPGDNDDNRDDNKEVELRKESDEKEKNSTQSLGSDLSKEGRKEERSINVQDIGRKNSDTEIRLDEDSRNDASESDSHHSTHQFEKREDISDHYNPAIANQGFCRGSLCDHSASVSPSSLNQYESTIHPKASDFKKLDVIEKGLCIACGGKKYLPHIEKLTERRRKLPPTEEPWYLCRECYEEAVRRERASAPPLPGLIDVNRLERVTSQIGKCSVCGLEKATWRDKEQGIAVCEGCWERENITLSS